ncbi:MAG: SAVED domain-containing protein [Proteobacteria bacterium]|nr:SAVED domain-containing protein [Pseudomonadota bacterium]
MVASPIDSPTLSQPPAPVAPPVYPVARSKIKRLTELLLVAGAAGRCEFCNEFLYTHPITGESGNFAENAHIVAFSTLGPRGFEDRPTDIDDVSNLMLLCARDHKLIDDHPERYTRAMLEQRKREHEARIKRVTAIGPAMQTTVVTLKVQIGSDIVHVNRREIFEALQPRYPADNPLEIDFVDIGPERSGAFYELAAERIQKNVARLYDTGGELERTGHLSVFALAPIPLLMLFGHALSNKVSTDFFQCHRTRSDNRWTWYEGDTPVRFSARQLRQGTAPHCVGLVLSVSGPFAAESLPSSIDERYTLYEIYPRDIVPHRSLIRQRDDLEAFRARYRALLAEIQQDHPGLRELHLFPAVPAPVAVTCGFDLLPKVDPTLIIYDNLATEGGFVQRLKVNLHE